MKKLISITALILFVKLALAQSYTVEFIVTGIDNSKGTVNAAMFNNNNDFPDSEKAYKGKVLNAKKGSMKFVFTNIPKGDYAFAVLHDENKNDKLDTNLLGIPKEGYCFSNNAMGRFGPPSFEKAKIFVNKDIKTTAKIRD